MTADAGASTEDDTGDDAPVLPPRPTRSAPAYRRRRLVALLVVVAVVVAGGLGLRALLSDDDEGTVTAVDIDQYELFPDSRLRTRLDLLADKVTIARTADEAHTHWRDEERNQALFGDDSRGEERDVGASQNLNRSFSGTY